MGAYGGNYTRSGDPEAMFSEANRYLGILQQAGVPVVDADVNEGMFSMITAFRRIIENAIGDGSPNDGFEIVESGISTVNNFEIKGGDGTDDGAGRLFLAGLPCFLKDDVDYSGPFVADMLHVMPQITDLSATVLTDSTANWTVNEHASKTLTPTVAVPGTTFTIVSNTANTLTVVGDLTVGAVIGNFYRVELSTPSGSNRNDEVYLDVFWDEVDELEDTNLNHTDLTPTQPAAYRLVLRQYVRVVEDATTPADFVDSDGRQHYTLKIATLARLDGNSAVTTAMITDDRTTFTPGGGSIQLEDESAIVVIPVVTRIRVDDASLVDEGGGVARLTTGGGGGGATGTISRGIPVTFDITAETGAAAILVGTDIDAQAYITGVDRSQKFRFIVPADYSSGDLTISINYAMDFAQASPNNEVRLQTEYQVVNAVSGAINAFGPFAAVETTLETVIFSLLDVLVIPGANFTAGDSITVFFRRLGSQPSDVHTGDMELVQFYYSYLGQIVNRGVTQGSSGFFSATGEADGAAGTIGTDIDTLDFSTSVDNNAKSSYIVPDHWDGLSDAVFHVLFAMAAGAAAPNNIVQLEFYGELVNPSTGAITTLATQTVDVAVPNDTDPHRTAVAYSIPVADMVPGAALTIVITRRTAVSGDHAELFQLLDIPMTIGILSSGGLQITTARELYLNPPDVAQVAGTISSNTVTPALASDFELYDFLRGDAASSQGDMLYQGRLGEGQTSIAKISIAFKNGGSGTADYVLKVYVEGQGATAVFDSGTVAAPGTRTLTTLTSGDLSFQPSGEGRYFVAVECSVGTNEEVHMSRPFVREE